MVPAVAGLERQGASRGAVLSFMIATPETGVDSIALTWALMDPLMAVIRPVAAFLTAITAGLLENRFGKPPVRSPNLVGGFPGWSAPAALPLRQRLTTGLRFAFVDLLGDIGPYFILGILIAGAISAVVPASLITTYLGSPLLAMPVMLLVSLPMYVCATASTPIAAALVLKGLSPGAALVFLLAGPATNAATLCMLNGMMGRRTTAIYLAAIATCSLALGVATDRLYRILEKAPGALAGNAAELLPEPLKMVAAVILLGLITPSIIRWGRRLFTPAPE